jgi:hypothetical protein
LFLV